MAAGASTPAPTWTTYFYPLTVGWTCHESLTSGATGEETLTVSAVTPVKQGRQVTVDEGSSTTVKGTEVPSNAALHYILTRQGQLVSEPSSGQLAGQAFRVEGNTVYPTVATLLRGGSGLSDVRIVAPLDKSKLSQLRSVLKAHATELEMAIELKQSGSKVASLTTPAGTFHDVLAVHSTLRKLDITNATSATRHILDSEIEPTLAQEEANTVWYAPAYGPVKVDVGGVIGVITGCAAAASS